MSGRKNTRSRHNTFISLVVTQGSQKKKGLLLETHNAIWFSALHSGKALGPSTAFIVHQKVWQVRLEEEMPHARNYPESRWVHDPVISKLLAENTFPWDRNMTRKQSLMQRVWQYTSMHKRPTTSSICKCLKWILLKALANGTGHCQKWTRTATIASSANGTKPQTFHIERETVASIIYLRRMVLKFSNLPEIVTLIAPVKVGWPIRTAGGITASKRKPREAYQFSPERFLYDPYIYGETCASSGT